MDENLPANLGRRIGDLRELPDELRRHLQVGKLSALETSIIELIRDDYEGAANVDEILVGLYRRTGEIHPRQYIANKLYRMGQADQIASVTGRRGVYRSK